MTTDQLTRLAELYEHRAKCIRATIDCVQEFVTGQAKLALPGKLKTVIREEALKNGHGRAMLPAATIEPAASKTPRQRRASKKNRAADVMAWIDAKRPRTVEEICVHTGLSLSYVGRALGVMRANGYVKRDKTGRYVLTSKQYGISAWRRRLAKRATEVKPVKQTPTRQRSRASAARTRAHERTTTLMSLFTNGVTLTKNDIRARLQRTVSARDVAPIMHAIGALFRRGYLRKQGDGYTFAKAYEPGAFRHKQAVA
jgi:DNA-binding transcriptional ArsR family regulator